MKNTRIINATSATSTGISNMTAQNINVQIATLLVAIALSNASNQHPLLPLAPSTSMIQGSTLESNLYISNLDRLEKLVKSYNEEIKRQIREEQTSLRYPILSLSPEESLYHPRGLERNTADTKYIL
jgi:hypothetical protein